MGSSDGITYVPIAPPLVQLTMPENNFITNALTQNIVGIVTTESTVETVTITVTTDGQAQTPETVAVSDNQFSATVPLEREGNASIHVAATDASDQTGSATILGSIDRTPPALTITSPEPGTVFTD